jgi:hypothetical protein
MLARRLDPPEPSGWGGAQPAHGAGRLPAGGLRSGGAREGPSAAQRARGRWRRPDREPTRGPRGEVRWWERPAPRGDTQLWAAVQRLQARRIARRLPVKALAAELRAIGHPIRRETLSRVLNGRQGTSWDTAEALAEILGVDLDDLRAAPDDEEPGVRLVPLDS